MNSNKQIKPTRWSYGDLLNFLELKRGHDLPLQDRCDGEYPIIGSNGVTGFHNKAISLSQGVITGRSGTLGKVYFSEKPYWPLNTSLYIVDFKGNAPKYCYYFLKHFPLEKFGTGTGVPTLNRNIVHKQKVVFPPVLEQQKIADILSTVDKKIDLIDQKIEETEKLKIGIMQKLFSEGIGVQDENGDWQPHTEFQNSPFGKIPRAWKYAPVKSLVSIKSPKYDPKIKTESLPCIELEHLSQGSGEILGTVNSLELASTKNCFAKGDVLFGKLRPYLKKFAKPNFNGVCSSEIWVMKTTDNKVLHNDFWFYFIQSERFINEANKSCGTKMPRADWKVVSELILPIPSFCEQLGIAKILECVDAKLGLLKQQKAETQRLKKGLMQKLLTGEWRVPVEETEAA
ncbi:TPA: restriction endonuclease subunit S [Vibrio diabolicus]